MLAAYVNTELKEQPIYGSSRLGMYLGGAQEGKEKLGLKRYELNNHLGNVMAVITDNINIDSVGVMDSVIMVSDYYPFGLDMPERSISENGYRYGFNGKEKDFKKEFNSQLNYDYGFRIFNPSIGRFLSIDPLTGSYPGWTPYSFSQDRPVDGLDLDGMERFHYALVGKTNEGEPILQFLGRQDVKSITIRTVLSFMGDWANITLKVPLERQIAVWELNNNGVLTGPGYLFRNMEQAFNAAENNFEEINKYDPEFTITAREMWLNDFIKTSESIGNLGFVLAGIQFGELPKTGRLDKTLANDVKGWKVGSPINNLTRTGDVPTWSTVRARYWKNRAFNAKPSEFSIQNVERMRNGLAPQRFNEELGEIESMELHHTPPQREGGLFDVREVWPAEHESIDPFRKTGNATGTNGY